MAISPISHNPVQTSYGALRASEQNYLHRAVAWIREDRPWYEQAVVYTAVALAAIALTASVVGIPLLFYFCYEYENQAVQSAVNAGDRAVVDCFGGPGQWEKIPKRTVPGYFNWEEAEEVSPQSMRNRLERAEDQFGRPGVLLRLQDRHTHRDFVLGVYRKFVLEDIWSAANWSTTVFEGDDIDPAALKTLRQIVSGRHPRYSLH